MFIILLIQYYFSSYLHNQSHDTYVAVERVFWLEEYDITVCIRE